ncbi:MAG: histidine phosphatase family protein [Ignavibacteriales bacterium]|nr:histidine phosphatase family protein [Ignavibacteriales bacterium]
MKTLLLVRHAKSSWKESELDDKDRPLNKRGEHDAPIIGKLLMKRKIIPDLIITSPAVRALTTAEIIANELDYSKKKIIINDDVYLASTRELIDVISDIKHEIKTVMLFGHNPGITDFLNHLCIDKVDNMPTCSVACIEFEIDSWNNVKNSKGKLKFFEHPKKYLA